MTILHISNYIDPHRCKILRNWCFDNLTSFTEGKTLDDDNDAGILKKDPNRKISIPQKINQYPQEVFDIHNQLRCQYPFLKKSMVIWNNGILAGIIHPPGDFYPHVDDNYKRDDLSVVGFNLLVSQPESGGVVTVGEQSYEMNCGDLMAYLITDYRHSVSAIGGNIPRVMWYWRFYVNKEDWENQ